MPAVSSGSGSNKMPPPPPPVPPKPNRPAPSPKSVVKDEKDDASRAVEKGDASRDVVKQGHWIIDCRMYQPERAEPLPASHSPAQLPALPPGFGEGGPPWIGMTYWYLNAAIHGPCCFFSGTSGPGAELNFFYLCGDDRCRRQIVVGLLCHIWEAYGSYSNYLHVMIYIYM